jgi:hypothetical protein
MFSAVAGLDEKWGAWESDGLARAAVAEPALASLSDLELVTISYQLSRRHKMLEATPVRRWIGADFGPVLLLLIRT